MAEVNLIGNFDHGFWLIQKLDCFGNRLKNPGILCRKLFVLGSFGYDHLLKKDFFLDFSSLCGRSYMVNDSHLNMLPSTINGRDR